MKKMIIAGVTLAAAHAGMGQNILLDGEFTADSYQDRLSRAIDTKMSTGWNSTTKENAQARLEAKFSSPKNFNAVSLFGSNLKEIQVAVLDGEGNWRASGTLKRIQEGRYGKLFDGVKSVHGIRLDLRGGAAKKPIVVIEVDIHVAKNTDNLALFKPVSYTDNSDECDRGSERRLTDGSSVTRYDNWSSWKGATPVIDLGKRTKVSRLVLRERGILEKLTVSVSDDAQQWSQVAVDNKGKSPVHKLDLGGVEARYVKVKLEGPGRNYATEIEIY